MFEQDKTPRGLETRWGETLSFLTSPPKSTAEKDFHRQPCFFFVRFDDIWLRTEFKAVEEGKWKKKKKKKGKKKKWWNKRWRERDRRSLQMSCCFFYKRQLLIFKFVFFFLEKAEIGHTWCSVNHDSASNQYRLHAWWVIHQVTAFKWVRCYLIRCVIVSSAKRRSSSSLKGIYVLT